MLQAQDILTISFKYQFKEWTGREDPFNLCGQYLSKVKDFVTSGQTKLFTS